jgi:DNA polymerase-3 subunit alpha
MPALALTEHGNVSSHVQLEKAALASGIKPIFGVELYCAVGERQRKNHLTVLAETQEGYSNLLELVSHTFSEGFYYEPTANGDMLKTYRQGLIVLSGCQGSLLFTSLVGGKNIDPKDASFTRALRVARRFKHSFGDSYYIEVQAFPHLEGTRNANPYLADIARRLDVPLVATFDCHYTVPEEREIQQVLHNIRPGERRTLEEMTRDWGYDENLCPPWTDNMVIRKLVGTGLTHKEATAAVMNTNEIMQRCHVEIPNLEMVRFPGDKPSREIWRDWLQEGWRYRGCHTMSKQERKRYRERLKHEMDIIESKDFVDYFLIVSDAVRWAKDNDIAVGPARGSAAASLACWLLRITEVNPMLYSDLVFERFIDVTRTDLPDIDLDFDSERRGEVRSYLVGKYGEACVNNVGTFSTFKAKNSLDDAARVYRVPQFEVEKIKRVLVERSSGDLRASATIEDTVEQFDVAAEVFENYPDLAVACDLEGNVKGFGVHAAGLVISTNPLHDMAAIYEREVKGEKLNVISMDKYDAEQKGLLKLDFLGLNTMTAINKMRLELGWSLDDLYNYPLDDERVIQGFRENDVAGIFQYEGRAMRYVNGALQPDSFKEICDVNALARPGPLHNGAAEEYIEIKWGRREPELIHPALEEITEPTKFQIVYQEQILRILGEIGDFDWTHRNEVRRIISRKIGEQEFNKRWGRFLDGARRLHNMDDFIAREIWGRCITAGSYAFNAAHTVAYSHLGYLCMIFKRLHPEIFYQEQLKVSDKERAAILLRDTQRHGRKLEVKPPHPVRSQLSWSSKRGKLQAGFVEIPGVGHKVGSKIVEYRNQDHVKSWEDLQGVKGVGPKTIAKMEAFANERDPFRARWLDDSIEHVRAQIESGRLSGLPIPTHRAIDLPYQKGETTPVVWLGAIYIRNVRDIFEYNQKKGVELDVENMTIRGKPIKDPHLTEFCIMVGDDETDMMGFRADRWKYPRLKKHIWAMEPGKDLVLIEGVRPHWMPMRNVVVDRMWIIDPEIG